MLDYLENKILGKIIDNCNFSKKKGMIIASPSNDPPYKFHWIRDSALVMRVFIDLYVRTKEDKYFMYLLNYIENESYIQNLDTLTHLGEPKINIDGTPYNEPWGRPQNDGPALRGINLIKIYNLIKDEYKNIGNNILDMIKKDLNYILENYNKPCFDLWEEFCGWHFYTRMIQLKFVKSCIELNEKLNIQNLDDTINNMKDNLLHHIDKNNNNTIISSFDENGNISKYDDASIIMSFSHIDYDKEIMELIPLDYGVNTCNNLINFFRNKYDRDDLNMIGRYANDKYYDGQIWIICTLGMLQYFLKLSNFNTKYKNLNLVVKNVFDFIISIDINLDLAEQYDINSNKQMSAEKLTWNYSELYMTYKSMSLNNI